MTAEQSSPESAAAFLDRTERDLLVLTIESSRADWVYATHITDDTEALSALTLTRVLQATARAAKAGVRFDRSRLSADELRKIDLLRLSMPLAAPSDPVLAEELTRLVASMSGKYGKARYAPRGTTEPLDLQGLSRILAERRDPAQLKDVWEGWHGFGRTIRPEFVRYVELANQGARELDFDDTGAMWRSKYDMPPADLEREVTRLWEQVRPFYLELHAYVRRRLGERYGTDLVPQGGPIPAHLLGNMWSQSWENILPLVAPKDAGAPPDLTAALVRTRVDPKGMVRFAERFFVSLGLPPLPPSFWERSMFTKPRDREVICHASAWDLDFVDDLRIKMCIEITGEDFRTIHHELGHNYYQRAYAGQPFLYRDGAHDGFHEAIGDTIALSVTPGYLTSIDLGDATSGADRTITDLLAVALEKVAFLPFGFAIDAWRWRVFAGAVAPEAYNPSWWAMRRDLQGIEPPGVRAPTEFDAGAKAHVPSNVPYLRYFLAHILQFQFHRALVREAGLSGPLHAASIFGSHAAGRRLAEMLALGQSRPWPDALAACTGESTMDGGALLEYFAPLRAWLREENRGHPVGWSDGSG